MSYALHGCCPKPILPWEWRIQPRYPFGAIEAGWFETVPSVHPKYQRVRAEHRENLLHELEPYLVTIEVLVSLQNAPSLGLVLAAGVDREASSPITARAWAEQQLSGGKYILIEDNVLQGESRGVIASLSDDQRDALAKESMGYDSVVVIEPSGDGTGRTALYVVGGIAALYVGWRILR